MDGRNQELSVKDSAWYGYALSDTLSAAEALVPERDGLEYIPCFTWLERHRKVALKVVLDP